MVISALIIVGYTTLGGFLAASTTDFIQSIIMSIALVIVFIFGINVAGGVSAVVENAQSLLISYNAHDLRSGFRNRTALSDYQYRIHDCMGTWIFRHATYPAPLYGH